MGIRNFFLTLVKYTVKYSVLYCKKKFSQVTENVHHLVKIKGGIK